MAWSRRPVIPARSTPGPDKASVLERKVEFLEGLVNGRDLAARAWSELEAAAPERLWPTEVVWKAGEVKIVGSALSYDLLADFISRLEEEPTFDGCGSPVVGSEEGPVREYYEFTVAARAVDDGGAAPPLMSGPVEARLAELEKAL